MRNDAFPDMESLDSHELQQINGGSISLFLAGFAIGWAIACHRKMNEDPYHRSITF